LAEAPAWLGAVYAVRRERTTDLVWTTIDTLQKEGKPVSITSVEAVSRHLDPLGKGVSQSALLHNLEARHYEAHRTWKGGRSKRATPHGRLSEPATSKCDRDLARARQPYLRLSKRDIVERVLAVEQACAEHEQALAAYRRRPLRMDAARRPSMTGRTLHPLRRVGYRGASPARNEH
jgi:hypothetical protein